MENKRIKILPVIVSIIITFSLCATAFLLFFNYYMKNLKVELTKTETLETVTVTDTGIADSVEKVYDSVGSIENYKNDRLQSTGSGFVFKVDDNKGYILTNHHVIEDASKLYFILTNREKVEVEVVGSDKYSDIAVLSIEKDKVIKVAEIGDNSITRIGDTVFTVGAPLDSDIYYQSVTRGVLSGKERLVEVSTSSSNVIMEVLQTDAAINSGNSGGPLCNSNGEVIGINSLKLASSSIEGMGFAIPIEKAIEYANVFISGEEIKRPFLGITMYDAYDVNGTYVYAVSENSPAYSAGLKRGDIITKINGVSVSSSSYLKYELYKYNVGDTIKITYERNSIENEIEITLISN
ncbi:MAG: PDZ domain-containing protein [Firmicutes bacterium]|nr:PDZ domain-containing protein [Bacillota bacterium]